MLLYQRHLATHDDNPDADCTCEKCSEAMGESTTGTAPDTSKTTQNKKAKRPSTAGILQKMRMRVLNEGDDGEDDDDKDEVDSQFQCGLCSSSFDSPADLEKHVKVHYKSAAAEAEAKRAADSNDDKNGAGGVAANIIQEMSASSKVRLTDNADRNWAAEFGYGKTTKAKPSGDLFQKMKSKFDLGEKDDEGDIMVVASEKEIKEEDEGEEEGDESFKVFRTRGFTGKVKASPKKVPRTLSDASLATRRRIESLIKRAREHQEKKNEARKNSENKNGSTAEPNSGNNNNNSNGNHSNSSSRRSKRLQQEDNADDDEIVNDDESVASFDGFEDEDEALLYPLANGWVMERTPVSSRGRPPLNRQQAKRYLTSFWSPEGQQYEGVDDIREYCKKEKVSLDVAVFEKALAKLTAKK